jgi:hypothetical protein
MLSSVTTLVRYALSSCPAVAAAPNGGSVPQTELRTFLHQKFPVRLAFRPRVGLFRRYAGANPMTGWQILLDLAPPSQTPGNRLRLRSSLSPAEKERATMAELLLEEVNPNATFKRLSNRMTTLATSIFSLLLTHDSK